MGIALDTINVAKPCEMDWDDMAGDDRARHCSHCNKTVHDLSVLGPDRARALIEADPDRCVRFYRNTDGIVWTAGAIPVASVSRRGWLAATAALAVGLIARRARADAAMTDPGSVASVCAEPTRAPPKPAPMPPPKVEAPKPDISEIRPQVPDLVRATPGLKPPGRAPLTPVPDSPSLVVRFESLLRDLFDAVSPSKPPPKVEKPRYNKGAIQGQLTMDPSQFN